MFDLTSINGPRPMLDGRSSCRLVLILVIGPGSSTTSSHGDDIDNRPGGGTNLICGDVK
jgi:hypothetical protein